MSVLTVRGQQFHFTNSGHVWILGNCDDVLPRGLCVALMLGKFYANEHVEAEQEKQGAVCIDWIMQPDSHE